MEITTFEQFKVFVAEQQGKLTLMELRFHRIADENNWGERYPHVVKLPFDSLTPFQVEKYTDTHFAALPFRSLLTRFFFFESEEAAEKIRNSHLEFLNEIKG